MVVAVESLLVPQLMLDELPPKLVMDIGGDTGVDDCVPVEYLDPCEETMTDPKP